MSNPTPVEGSPSEAEAQGTALITLQAAASADGNGTAALIDGFSGPCFLEIQKTGTGTTTANLEGSIDGSVWYAAGYQQLDNTAAPARAVAGIAVPAGAVNHIYQVLDDYPMLRCRLSGTTGTVSLTARVYAVPET
jgi:hypothetical protein